MGNIVSMGAQSNKYRDGVFCVAALCALGGFSSSVYAGLDRAREAGLVPHKALYDVRLSSKKSSANVVDVRGKMFYEWQPSCDAWVSTHRFDMTYVYVEAPAVRVTSDFSTYESFDGKNFNFTLQRKREGVVFEEIRGSVQADDQDLPSEAVYSIPEDLVFHLPKDTLFPMAHTLAVLAKIKSGEKFYKATIFDGSDEEGPVDINSFIAEPAVYDASEGRVQYIDQSLVSSKGWSIRLAFFPLNNFESAADYEMSVLFHENGVISDMEVDYGDFSVTQELLAIEPLGDACSSGGSD